MTYGVVDEEYELVDEPDFGYRIHLNKLSYGWKPLFQKHKAFKTWRDLEKFYLDHAADLMIYDEYNEQHDWDWYKEKVLTWAKHREPIPLKWVYGVSDFDKKFHKERARATLHTEECSPEEAELWLPFDHREYMETEKAARRKFPVDYYWQDDMDYERDPDEEIDWVSGEFS